MSGQQTIILVVVLVILVLGYMHYYGPVTTVATDMPVPGATPAAVVPPSSAPTYVYNVSQSGVWATEEPGAITCPTAAGVNLSGNAGDYVNYCIFNNESDAVNYCNANPGCQGYVYGSEGKYQISNAVAPNSYANGTYKLKTQS